jgi:hydrogenase maturation protease
VHQLTPELAEPVGEANLAIFIDASDMGEPDTWRCDQANLRCASGNSLGHHFDVAGLLAYSEAVFNATPRALVISGVVESFDFRDHLAPTVEAALPELIDYMRKMVCGADSSQTACIQTGN